MNSFKKTRLDIFITEKGFVSSRNRARALIMTGRVLVNNQPADKPGTLVSDSDVIRLKGEDLPFVSRGGIKLQAALVAFNIDVSQFICLDVGASTGGFTDCLLQNGAKHVFAVDVGYGQLAWKLQTDSRVTSIERSNIRYLTIDNIPDPVDLVTIDVSFISLKTVIPSILKFMKPDAGIIALIKPQFEVGKGKVGKGGIVKDPEQHTLVIQDLQYFSSENELVWKSMIPSPILGTKGNKEFMVFLKKGGQEE